MLQLCSPASILNSFGELAVTFDKMRLIRFVHACIKEANIGKSCLMSLFLKCRCLKPDGGFLSSEEVGRVCSRLIYMCKLVVYEWYDVNGDLVNLSADGLEGKGKNWPTLLYLLHHRATKEKKTVRKDPIFTEIDPGRIVKVDTLTIDVFKISTALEASLLKVDHLLKKLSFDADLTIEAGDVVDDNSIRTPGYRMKLRKPGQETRLLQAILARADLRERFVSGVDSNNVALWHRDEIWSYLALHDSLMKNLLFLTHLLSGMPGRATELATYTLANGRSKTRVVSFDGERIMFSVSYSKTNNMTGTTKFIARYLSPRVTTLLLREILFVRPLVLFFREIVDTESVTTYATYLWVAKGKKMEAEDIRNHFATLMVQYTKMDLTFSTYRHLMSYLKNYL